jgi:mRNA interferase RelE/StbE
MTPFRTRYTSAAAASIRHLHPSVKQAVREAIRDLAEEPELGRPLMLELAGFRSLRVSRYRVIYCVGDPERVLEIHLVGIRRDVYETFRALLQKSADR